MLFFKGYRGAPQFSVEHHGALRTNVGIWFSSSGSWLTHFPWWNYDTDDEESMKAITKLPWWHDWKVNLRKKKWSLSKRLSTNLIPGSISANSSFFTIIYLYKFVHFPFSLFVCATVCTGRTKCVLCFVYIPFSPNEMFTIIKRVQDPGSRILVSRFKVQGPRPIRSKIDPRSRM